MSVLLHAFLILLALSLDEILSASKDRGSRWNKKLMFMILVVLGSCFAAFIDVNHEWWWMRKAGKSLEEVKKVLVAPMCDGRTIYGVLMSEAREDEVVLSSFPQEVHIVTGMKTIGLTGSLYTKQVWDKEATMALSKRFDAKWIISMGDFDRNGLTGNQVFFRDLLDGYNHPELEAIGGAAGAKLFRIISEEK